MAALQRKHSSGCHIATEEEDKEQLEKRSGGDVEYK